MHILNLIFISIAGANSNTNLMKSRNVSINSADCQSRTDLWLSEKRNLKRLRYRVNVDDNVFEKAFSQIYFGESLRKLDENKIIEYEEVMAGIAQNLTNPRVSVKCTWINQGNRRKRIDRMIKRKKVNRRHKRKNKSNRDLESSNDYLILHNLNECSTKKTVSLTVKFYLTWSSTLDENVTKYFESYTHYVNSHEGRLITASQLREINICAISAKSLKVIPFDVLKARGQFNQTYIGPSTVLDADQLIAYEAYFEGLTKEYTYDSVITKCSILNQEIDYKSLVNMSSDYELPWYPDPDSEFYFEVKVNYVLTWDVEMNGRMLQIPEEDIEEELRSNFTNYINKEGNIKDIERFMKSIDVTVYEVGLIFAIANMTNENTTFIASGQFNQFFAVDSILSLEQIQKYETFYENLTKEYTDDPVIANCTVMDQEILLWGMDQENFRYGGKKWLKLNYRFEWELITMTYKPYNPNDRKRLLQTKDEDMGKQLVSNFTNYINENETINEIKEFINSIYVPITTSASVSPTYYPTSTVSNIHIDDPIKKWGTKVIQVSYNINWRPIK